MIRKEFFYIRTDIRDNSPFLIFIDGFSIISNKKWALAEIYLKEHHPDEYREARRIQDEADILAERIYAEQERKKGNDTIPYVTVNDHYLFGRKKMLTKEGIAIIEAEDERIKATYPEIYARQLRAERQVLHDGMAIMDNIDGLPAKDYRVCVEIGYMRGYGRKHMHIYSEKDGQRVEHGLRIYVGE